MSKKQKALKITISGSYRTADHKVVDYQAVSGIIPFCDEDVAFMHIKSRYAPIWITTDGRYQKDRVYSVRETYVDSIEEIEHEFSYVGKDIKLMTAEELQDLATAKDLREIPLWRKGSVRHAQNIAYAQYSKLVLGKKIDHRKEGFNVAKLPPIIVGAEIRKDTTRKMTNDEYLSRAETNNVSDSDEFEDDELEDETALTLPELKEIAKRKGITFHPTIGRDALYKRVYPDAA
mgnify:CR=1 FL=1